MSTNKQDLEATFATLDIKLATWLESQGHKAISFQVDTANVPYWCRYHFKDIPKKLIYDYVIGEAIGSVPAIIDAYRHLSRDARVARMDKRLLEAKLMEPTGGGR